MLGVNTVLYLVGIGLIILGGSSGIALFMRAMGKSETLAQGPGMTTLWGLFLIGILAGLMLISVSQRN
jgi:hypothetical protein